MGIRERNYWIEEAKSRLLKNEGRADSYVYELMSLYDLAANNIEKEIYTLFGRYAKDNELTEAAASAMLSGQEYSRWRKSIEKYLADASETAADSKSFLELNTLAMKSRISRKEQLLSNVYQNMIDLADDCNTTLESLLGDLLKANYYESCYTLQRGFSVGFRVTQLDSKTIKLILSHPWSERTFSENVWGRCDHLSALAKRELTLGFIQGSSVQKMAKNINDIMGAGKGAAERLVRTEAKYFSNQGELLGYRENGIQRYRYIGGNEGSGKCDCAALNGQTFSVDEAEAGINFPPLHPNCLCSVVADFGANSMFELPNAEPLANNPKYQDWLKEYGGAS